VVPNLPSMPKTPPTTEPNLDDALTDWHRAGSPQGGGGLKPASVGAVPSIPLQPWGDERGGVTGRPGAGPGSPRRGVPGGGAMGGGMGGAPTQGAGQGAGKGKRVQAEEDESLYTEEREWTEGLIGRRRVKETPDE
jgi:hypothetical protein